MSSNRPEIYHSCLWRQVCGEPSPRPLPLSALALIWTVTKTLAPLILLREKDSIVNSILDAPVSIRVSVITRLLDGLSSSMSHNVF